MISTGPLSRAAADEINRALELLASINKMSAAAPLSIRRGYGQQPLFSFIDYGTTTTTPTTTTNGTALGMPCITITRDVYGVITNVELSQTMVKPNGDTYCQQIQPCVPCPISYTVLVQTNASTPVPLANRNVSIGGVSLLTNSSGIATFANVPVGTVTVTLVQNGSESSTWGTQPAPTASGTGFVATGTASATLTPNQATFTLAGSTPVSLPPPRILIGRPMAPVPPPALSGSRVLQAPRGSFVPPPPPVVASPRVLVNRSAVPPAAPGSGGRVLKVARLAAATPVAKMAARIVVNRSASAAPVLATGGRILKVVQPPAVATPHTFTVTLRKSGVALSGRTVTFNSTAAVSGISGIVTFSGVPDGSYTVSCATPGGETVVYTLSGGGTTTSFTNAVTVAGANVAATYAIT